MSKYHKYLSNPNNTKCCNTCNHCEINKISERNWWVQCKKLIELHGKIEGYNYLQSTDLNLIYSECDLWKNPNFIKE